MKENQEEQSTREIYPKKISPDVTKVASDTNDLVPDKSSKNNNSIQFVNRINDSSSFFGLLPNEMLLQILGYFTLHELYGLKLVHTSWQQTIESLPNIELLRTYEVALKGSKLWHYLPAIINNKSILEFIKERLFPFQLPKYREEQFDKITTFCAWILNKLIRSHCELSYRNKITSDNLIQQAQFIWNNIKQFGQSDAKKLENWFAFLWKHHEIQLNVFKTYLDFEGILTTLILIIQSQHPNVGRVRILCDSPANRWLRGKDLIFIGVHHFSLLYEMVKQSICLHAYFQDTTMFKGYAKQVDPILLNQYQQRLVVLDNLLGRLTPPDWLQFLELDELDNQHYRTAILKEAIETNHPVIPRQLTETLSLKLASIKQERVPPKILENQSIESVLLSLRFDTDEGQSDDDYTILKRDPLLQEAYEQLQETQAEVAASKKQRQEIEEYLNNLNERQSRMQYLENTEPNAQEDEIEEDAQDPLLAALPSDPITTTLTQPSLPKKPVAPASFNWRLALKIGGTILLGLIGVGFIATGVGSFVGLPLLMTLDLPLFAQILLLTAGIISLLVSVAIGIAIGCCSTRKTRLNQPIVSPDDPDDKRLPSSPPMLF
jgi:hypothetical protein